MTGRVGSWLAVAAVVAALVGAVFAVVRLRARRGVATAMQRATYDVLHTATLAAEPLRTGLTAASAGKAARHLRALVGAVGLAIINEQRCLAYDGSGDHHTEQLTNAARRAISTHRTVVLSAADLPCDRVDCVVRGAVIAPLSGSNRSNKIDGPNRANTPNVANNASSTDGADDSSSAEGAALVAVAGGGIAPGLVQATRETARWAGSQLALAELDSSRERLARAQVPMPLNVS